MLRDEAGDSRVVGRGIRRRATVLHNRQHERLVDARHPAARGFSTSRG